MATTTLNPRTIDEVGLRPKSRAEMLLGPEVYRILHGLITNPTSITGIAIIGVFAVIASSCTSLFGSKSDDCCARSGSEAASPITTNAAIT